MRGVAAAPNTSRIRPTRCQRTARTNTASSWTFSRCQKPPSSCVRLKDHSSRTNTYVCATNASDGFDEDDDDVLKIDSSESIADFDSLFALLAAKRRGEQLFAEEMNKSNTEIDFVKAAGYIAMHRRPDVSRVEDAINEIDELAKKLEKLLPENKEDMFPLRTLKQISRFMFDETDNGGLGFRGNDEEFYDPRNSCLDEVLARRVGIPITLSLIYMEPAKRVGLPMVGVNLPGRFMIRPAIEDMEVLVDCFNAGEVLFVQDVEEMLAKFYGAGDGGDSKGDSEKSPVNPPPRVTIDRSFFDDNSLRPQQFFTRVLTNLKQIYFNSEEYENALQIVGYQNHCSPSPEIKRFNRRDGGICLFLMQRWDEAREELGGYLEEANAAQVVEDEQSKNLTGDDKAVYVAKKLNQAKDRAQVVAMVAAAAEQSKRQTAEKMVNQAVGGGVEEDQSDEVVQSDTEKKSSKNENEKTSEVFDDDALRIVEDALRRSADDEDDGSSVDP